MIRRIATCVAAAALALCLGAVAQESYPSKPIKIYPPRERRSTPTPEKWYVAPFFTAA